MQVKVKLGKEWWLLPSDREFTKKDLELFHDVPYVATLEAGEAVRFVNTQKKKRVKMIIAKIAMEYYQGFRPLMKDGAIVFRKIRAAS